MAAATVAAMVAAAVAAVAAAVAAVAAAVAAVAAAATKSAAKIAVAVATAAAVLAVQCLPLPVLAGLAPRDPEVVRKAAVLGRAVVVVEEEPSIVVEWQSAMALAQW